MSQGFAISIQADALRYTTHAKPVLQDLVMQLPAQQWTCLLGRSGCGKTSILRKLAGLLEEAQWQGRIETVGQPLSGNIAYMAQQDLLLPWLSVLDNVCIAERLQGRSLTQDLRDKALLLLDKVGLKAHADNYPHTLSGGMRQRVALARTLLQERPIVLMDEPFSALDAVTRHKLQSLSFELLQGKTVLLVTHDPQEAVRLGHQIYVMEGSPASAHLLEGLASTPPRQLDEHSAALQNDILHRLGGEHV